jgi:ribonuclease P protein component
LRRPRIGIIVPRHKHTAVARNLVKRRLRALCRTTLLPALRERAVADVAVDVVVRATPAAYAVGYETLAAEIRRIATRLGSAAP